MLDVTWGLKRMPHKELCPACGYLLPDWHWEWHNQVDYIDIYRGIAGMGCPLCGVMAMFANALKPLVLPPAGIRIRRTRREVLKAAQWSRYNNNKSLDDYLKTAERRPYANYWTGADVQQADRHVSANP
jgi:hypothetical protein